MRWFGPKSWGAPVCQGTERIPVPVGETCFVCGKPIEAWHCGFEMPFAGGPGDPDRVYDHWPCQLRHCGLDYAAKRAEEWMKAEAERERS